jgi:hypothetical protein
MIKFVQKTVAEVAELAASKLIQRGGGRKVSVYLPAGCLPPTKRAYRVEKYDSQYGGVKIFSRPAQNGGWVVHVEFESPIVFNPVIPREMGERLKK